MCQFVTVQCAYCDRDCQKSTGHYNRSVSVGAKFYCNRKCAGGAKRLEEGERKRRLAENNRKYKAAKPEYYKAMKAAAYQKRRDPEKEREVRKANMPRHIAYCQRPEYKEYKRLADIETSKRDYGEYGEAYRLLLELQREIVRLVPDKYERLKARGYFDRDRVRERKSKWAREQAQQQHQS